MNIEKNFYEYVKELIPEKGSIFFASYNHNTHNNISLYQLADLICGKRLDFADYVTGYSWNVKETWWDYQFETIGLMFFREKASSENLDDCHGEMWIHFSKNAFIGAICIVATRNGIIFDDKEHENLRQIWARKLENRETENDKKITAKEDIECNFDDEYWVWKLNRKSLEK